MKALRPKGFTLLEMLIYSGVIAAISVFLIRSIISLTGAYRSVLAERDLMAGVRSAMQSIGRTAREAENIYLPTSILGNTYGQLSLKTRIDLPANETETYVDYYVDGGRLYEKREGADPLPLTPETVRVDRFFVERIMSGGNETARITLELATRNAGLRQASTTAVSGFTPRGNY